MQIKTIMRYHLIPVRMAIINKSTTNKCWSEWRKRKPFALLVGMQIASAIIKINMELAQKIKNGMPYGPAIPFLGIYLKKTKTLIWENISTPLYIATLFTISNIWKQLKCLSINEWIRQLGDVYTVEYYLAIKKKKKKFYPLQQHGWTWKTLC